MGVTCYDVFSRSDLLKKHSKSCSSRREKWSGRTARLVSSPSAHPSRPGSLVTPPTDTARWTFSSRSGVARASIVEEFGYCGSGRSPVGRWRGIGGWLCAASVSQTGAAAIRRKGAEIADRGGAERGSGVGPPPSGPGAGQLATTP